MKTLKRSLPLMLLVTLVALLTCFFRAGRECVASTDAEKLVLLSDENGTVVIAKEGVPFEYSIIFSSDAESADQSAANELAVLLAEKYEIYTGMIPDVVPADASAKEILLGNTNRDASAELLETIARATKNEDDLVWGMLYKDGKLAYTANSTLAFTYGLDDLFALLTDDSFSVPMSFSYIGSKTRAEYDAEIEAEKEANVQKHIEELKAKNDLFTLSDFGGKSKDIGTSPYARPDVYLPEGMHPRLYITEDKIDDVLKIMEDPMYDGLVKTFWDDVKREGCLDGFPVVNFKDPENKYEKDYYRYDTKIISALQNKAFAYLITGNELYGYEAIIGAKNMILTLEYSTYIHMDLYHGASHVMIAVAKIYDWCYHLMSDEDKEQIIAGIANVLGPQMESGMRFPPTGMNAISGHGTGPQFLRDWMMITIAVADERPEWWEFIAGRYYEQYVPAALEYTSSGWITQGTATYGPGKFYELMNPGWLIYLATGEMPYNEEDVSRSPYYMIGHLQANGRWFQTGDGGRNPMGATVDTNYLYIPAAMFQDSVLTAYLYALTDNMNSAAKPDWGNDCAAAVALSFISYFPEPVTDLYTHIDTIQYFDGHAGTTSARSSWDADAAVVLMKIGQMTMANHDIYDHGTFQIYYKGLLAATSGTYNKYGSNVHRYYLQSTVAHNGILVFNPEFADSEPTLGSNDPLDITNGARYFYSGSQKRRGEAGTLENWLSGTYDMGVLTGHAEGYDPYTGASEYAYIAGDITTAYDVETVEYLERRMLTVFTGDEKYPMLFFTFDTVESKRASFEKTYLIHTVNEPTIDEEKFIARITDNGGSLIVQSLFGADSIEKIGGEGKAYWINGYYKNDGTWVEGKNCVDQYAPNDNYKKFWGRLQLRTSGEELSQLFTAMYVTDAENEEAPLFDKYENDSVMTASFDNIISVFFKDKARAYKEFSFESEGKGLHRYYVSGIDFGTWQILVDDVPVASVYVEDDGAFASFIAPTGTVTFKPGRDVIGANGGRIQYVTGGGTLPSDTLYTYINENDFYLPTSATRGSDKFLGWYTTETCDAGTEIEYIPAGTLGTVRVYAKWLSIYVDEDYSKTKLDVFEKNMSAGGVNYNANTKTGASFTVKTDEDGVNYLEWIEGEKDPLITVTSTTKNFASMTSEDETVSFQITLARNGDAPIMPMHLRIQSNKEYGTLTDRVFGELRLFTLNSSGKIVLGSSGPEIGDISDGSKVTLRIAVDFKNETFIAYDENGFELQSMKFTVPTKSGAPNGSEWRKLMQQYLAYIYPSGSSDFGGELRIYGIKISESNVLANKEAMDSAITYKAGGGTLEKDAPRYYSKAEDTVLPTVTKNNAVFDGWYTTETFDEGTRIEKISPDTEGPVTVYAKWLNIFIDTDFAGSDINADSSGNKYWGLLGFVTNTKEGASVTTKTDNNGDSYIEWVKGSSDSLINATSTGDNISTMSSSSISYSFKFKKKANTPILSTSQVVVQSNVAYDGTDRVFAPLSLFKIGTNGNVTTSNGTQLGTINETDLTSINFTINFESGTITYYDEMNDVIAEVSFSAPEKSGAPSTLEWKKLFRQYLLYMRADDSSIDPSSTLLIYGITIKEGDIFSGAEIPDGNGIVYKTAGGTLPEGAPTEYDPLGETLLPTGVTKNGAIFAGWYTDPAFSDNSKITAIPAGNTKVFTVYAKWFNVVASEDYSTTEVNVGESTSQTIGPIRYNAGSAGEPKPGCYHVTETDENGNRYLKSVTAGKSVMAVVMSDSYNLTHFANPAITMQFSLKADANIPLGKYGVRISSSGGNFGDLNLLNVSANTGAITLNNSSVTIGTVGKDSFTKLNIVVRFDEETVSAYDEDGKLLDCVDLHALPTSKEGQKQPANWREWQMLSTNYLFYGMLSYQGSAEASAILFDDLALIDGAVYDDKGNSGSAPEEETQNSLNLITNGGVLENAPTKYDPAVELSLPSPEKNGYIFGGWYSTVTFDEGTRVEKIGIGAQGSISLYAKWYKAFVDTDFEGVSIYADDTSGASYSALTLGTNKKTGAVMKTETDENGDAYLEWTKGSLDSILSVQSTSSNFSTMNESVASYRLLLRKKAGTHVITSSQITLESNYTASGTAGVWADLRLFNINADGTVTVPKTNEVVATITEDAVAEIAFTIDFERGIITHYTESGEVLLSYEFTAPEKSGAASTLEWQKLIRQYMLYMRADNNSIPDSSSLMIYGITVAEGNIFAK